MSKKKSLFSGVSDWINNVRSTVKTMREKKKQSFLHAPVPNLGCDDSKQSMVVDVAPSTILKTVAVVMLTILLFYFLYDISGIILIFFIAFIFAAALDPIMDKMEGYKVPRWLTVLTVYILLSVFLGFFVTRVVTLLADQVIGIAHSVGQFVSGGGADKALSLPFGEQIQPYIDEFYETVDLKDAAVQLQSAFQILSTQLVSLSFGLFNLLIIFILTFFMVVEEKSIDEFFQSIFPSRYGQYVSTRMAAVKDQIGLWFRGQLLVSLIAGVLTYLGLVLMGVDYALTLSFIAGIAMIIPVVGRGFAWAVTFPIVFNQIRDYTKREK